MVHYTKSCGDCFIPVAETVVRLLVFSWYALGAASALLVRRVRGLEGLYRRPWRGRRVVDLCPGRLHASGTQAQALATLNLFPHQAQALQTARWTAWFAGWSNIVDLQDLTGLPRLRVVRQAASCCRGWSVTEQPLPNSAKLP